MEVPSSNEDEALDALLRAARAEPSAEQLHRVKQRLHVLAREVEAPRGRWGSGPLVSCLVAVGFSLLPAPRGPVVALAEPPPEPIAVAAEAPESVAVAAESPEPPSVVDAIPVEALASAQVDPQPEPASRALAEQARALRDRRPIPTRADAAPAGSPKPVAAAVPSDVTPSTTDEPVEQPMRVAEAPRQEGEASFLRRAKVALATDPAHALQITEEHPARYPRGVLLQEREVIAIKALIRLGRTHDARVRAAAFRSSYPTSAHQGHLDAEIERLLDGPTKEARPTSEAHPWTNRER